MGGKSDMATREDRPESGGSDPDDIREKSGLLDRDKQKFAQDMAEKQASSPAHPHDEAKPAPFSIGNEPNNARNAE
jgi:hypothetical protein